MNSLPDLKKDTVNATGLLHLYEQMLLIRKFELAVQENYKKGEVPGFIHLCVGQEAVAVGVCTNLRSTDWVTSTHRGHGHGLAKGVDVKQMLAELYGKATGTNGGRGGSMHIYSTSAGLFGTNGLVGGGIPLAVGLGMSAQVQQTDGVAVSFFGDGAICHGSFHESMSLAAVKRTPVVFVCENNLYATCTPVGEANLNADISSKAAAYGIPGVKVDGNDVLAVQRVTAAAIDRARRGEGPTLIEAVTYRTVGHHEGDVLVGTYRTREELDEWITRCPIKTFREYLLSSGKSEETELSVIDQKIDQVISEALAFARSSPYPDTSSVSENCWMNPVNPAVALAKQDENGGSENLSWLAAVRDGIAEEMRRDKNILYMGEGIGERGGTFGQTKNLWGEFGTRLIDTPICELGFTGAAAAASSAGCRTIADLMFADFIFDATTQIINQASKLRYMSNGQISVPMIIRAGSGQIKQAGPQHSGTFHSLWANVPGLIVVVPSTPADAKGLMKTALRAGDPVVFLESKSLMSSKGAVPITETYIPFGKARLVEEGSDITVVSFGQPVHSCIEAAKQLNQQGISCEIIDLRTIVPFDAEMIIKSVNKTGHLLVVDEAYTPCSVSAEIAAIVVENCFYTLKAPVGRLNKLSVPQPFSPPLEAAVSITPEKIIDLVKSMLNGVSFRTQYLPVSGITEDSSVVPNISGTSEVNDVPEETIIATPSDKNSIEISIPNLGLTITEVSIAQWHKKVGDPIKKGETILDFESEKSVVELESPVDGYLDSIVITEGITVPIGTVVGFIKQ
ncbi:thiamine pyrophosphate-dependent enzyme [Flavihumibacter fluvii]|uniref:thiamine pyrophosphate-dependent enzyme n=1 Tax=Flavihumibacter fluvii TaxID=2838157 RepID=UPI001BDEC8A4|nr:thiamine pyrophosphate-dependent enzyme [Flavihumibacter fluvii]ULQ51970.1 thiamine pyrophosphate-dependent enzyme [Flavihumibacter fluvii]